LPTLEVVEKLTTNISEEVTLYWRPAGASSKNCIRKGLSTRASWAALKNSGAPIGGCDPPHPASNAAAAQLFSA
jgi:hypothetical protein